MLATLENEALRFAKRRASFSKTKVFLLKKTPREAVFAPPLRLTLFKFLS